MEMSSADFCQRPLALIGRIGAHSRNQSLKICRAQIRGREEQGSVDTHLQGEDTSQDLRVKVPGDRITLAKPGSRAD